LPGRLGVLPASKRRSGFNFSNERSSMAAVPPTVGWMEVVAAGTYEWEQGTLSGAPMTPIAGLVHGGSPVIFAVGVVGTFTTTVTGNLTIGQTTISSVSSVADLAVGQGITALGYLPRNTAGGNASTIVDVIDSSHIEFGNGIYSEDAATAGGAWIDGWVNTIPAPASASAVTFTIADPAPIGTLKAVISPATGITLTDTNSDATGSVSYQGNGTAIANLSGQAEGNFEVAFGSAGTFTIACTYETSDPNYSSLAVSPSLVFVVS